MENARILPVDALSVCVLNEPAKCEYQKKVYGFLGRNLEKQVCFCEKIGLCKDNLDSDFRCTYAIWVNLNRRIKRIKK